MIVCFFLCFCGGGFDAIYKECDPDLVPKVTWYVNPYISRCPCEVDKAVPVVTMGLEGDCSLSEGQTQLFTSMMARALSDLPYSGANVFPLMTQISPL